MFLPLWLPTHHERNLNDRGASEKKIDSKANNCSDSLFEVNLSPTSLVDACHGILGFFVREGLAQLLVQPADVLNGDNTLPSGIEH